MWSDCKGRERERERKEKQNLIFGSASEFFSRFFVFALRFATLLVKFLTLPSFQSTFVFLLLSKHNIMYVGVKRNPIGGG